MNEPLRPYPEYKDSSLLWLGKVPAHWRLSQIRKCGWILGGGTPSMGRSDFWNGQIPWVSPKDMKQPQILDTQDHITDKAIQETALELLPVGSILLVVRGMILARRIPVAVTHVPVTINQDMKALVLHDGINPQFVAYALQASSDALFAMIDEAGHGTKRLPTMRWRQLEIAFPPPEEQTAIANYLDANGVLVRKFILLGLTSSIRRIAACP